jgi:hypothetical protein
MPRLGSTGKQVADTTVPLTTGIKTAKAIENITAPGVAGTEFTIAMAADVKAYRIRVRGAGKLQIADTTGQTNVTFETVLPGNIHQEESLLLAGVTTLFCELNKPSEVIEIVRWT